MNFRRIANLSLPEQNKLHVQLASPSVAPTISRLAQRTTHPKPTTPPKAWSARPSHPNQQTPTQEQILTFTRPSLEEDGLTPDVHLAVLAYRLQLAIAIKQESPIVLEQARRMNSKSWEILVVHVANQLPQFSVHAESGTSPSLEAILLKISQHSPVPLSLTRIPFSFSLHLLL